MATHLREQIMDAFVTTLTGLATTGANVHRLRVYPEEASALPSLNILQGEDSADENMVGVVDRHLDIIIEARVQAAGAIDQTLNQIAKEITVALKANPKLGLSDTVIFLAEGPTDEPEVSAEGSQPVAMMVMVWAVHYRTSADDPSVA